MGGHAAGPHGDDGRDRAAGLDRERIVEAAVELVAGEGAEALTMRRLARRLGTAPMSLYRHVDSKAALLGLVVERVARDLPAVDADGPWQATVRETLRGIRRVLVRHPGIGAAVTSQALFTPSALTVVEALLGALRAAGLGEEGAARTFAVLWNYTLGGVMVEQALLAGAAPAGSPGSAGDATGDVESERLLAEQRQRIVAALERQAGDASPVQAASPHWRDLKGQAAFEAGLDLLIAGIESASA